MEPRFSICIPAWEQGGSGMPHLKRLIESILAQSFKDYEIVISDHSKNNNIQDYVSSLEKKVKYTRYSLNYGNGPANTNNALRHCTGDIVKVMFQDDFMFSEKCLEAFNDRFKNGSKWVVCGSNLTKDGKNFYRKLVPRWNNRMLTGPNTIRTPSVIAFVNEDTEYFDELLVMRMDMEYYYRLGKKYGPPTVIKNCLVAHGIHPNQITSKFKGTSRKEKEYCLKKHSQ
jgi:glycosyltransferase involved in cell wall biosynthesis